MDQARHSYRVCQNRGNQVLESYLRVGGVEVDSTCAVISNITYGHSRAPYLKVYRNVTTFCTIEYSSALLFRSLDLDRRQAYLDATKIRNPYGAKPEALHFAGSMATTRHSLRHSLGELRSTDVQSTQPRAFRSWFYIETVNPLVQHSHVLHRYWLLRRQIVC